MAIQNRRGLYTELDKSKLLPGEFAFVTGQGEETEGELYFCYAAGKVKRCATKEDIELILATSPASYEALQKLIDDLENNPSELTNILNNIIQLQSIVSDLQEVKIDKTEKGAVNGVATLGEDGKVPNVQLPEIPMSAIDITYDNTESGMEAINTQDAIDELSQETVFLAGETERLDTEKVDEAEKGVADGIATLDSTGKIPLSQIPSGIEGNSILVSSTFPTVTKANQIFYKIV
jgi:hypothetical protein